MSAKAPSISGRRLQTRRSGVHGRGVFALQDIAEGETLIEYVGEVITWQEAQDRHPHDPSDPNHTFYFHVDADRVIDALNGGNSSRWINHSCNPNGEAVIEEAEGDDRSKDKVFIEAKRAIKPGQELTYNYGITLGERHTPRLKKIWECRCGSKNCTGTMLQPKR